MRPFAVLTYMIIILCVLENVIANVGDFIGSISETVGNVFHTAWSKISEAIKRPVRIRRLGRGGRRKRTTSITTPVTIDPDASTFAIYLFSGTEKLPSLEKSLERPSIPVFTTPSYKTLVEWRKLQIPYMIRPVKGIEDKPPTTPSLIDEETPASPKLSRTGNRRNLMFT